jgi:hypothetical protein
MTGLSCMCSDTMHASCDIPDTNYIVLVIGAVMGLWLWHELRDEEEEEASAPA